MANNSYQQMINLVDTIRMEGKAPKVTKLASQANRNRKSLFVPKSRGKGMIKVSWLHPSHIH